MYSLLLLAVVSFLTALLVTPLVREAFKRVGVVDAPDGKRKLHAAGIPRTGGLAIAVAYVTAGVVVGDNGVPVSPSRH